MSTLEEPILWERLAKRTERKFDGEDFRGAFLDHFDFSEASLVGTNFAGAHLECANFWSSDISGANFSGARLGRSSFRSAKGEQTDFSKIEAIAADFSMGTFPAARFCGAELEGANLTETNLTDADLTEASLANVVMSHTKLNNTNLAASFAGTILVNVDLHNARLLNHASCEQIFVDTTTLERLADAHHAGVNIVEALGALRRGGVTLPSLLASVLEDLSVADLDPDQDTVFDLIPEFRVALSSSPEEIHGLIRTLDAAEDERPLQEFFELNPSLLAVPLAANHRGWVIPQKLLGDRFRPDFMACGRTSLGHEWLLIELESPKVPLFTKKGAISQWLNTAIKQVRDWRNFLTHNLDYARRARQMMGLGLRDIAPEPPALILIGRQAGLDPKTDLHRLRVSKESRIEIRTYDYLVDACRKPPGSRVPLIRGSAHSTKEE